MAFQNSFPWQNPKKPATTTATGTGLPTISEAIPSFNALGNGASGMVNNLLSGLPSTSPSRRSAAYFGVGSGMPGSDFARNRGFDLYGEQAESNKQRGFDDFLKLLQGYSGTVAPTAGQQIQHGEFNSDLDFRREQADRQNSLEQQQLALKTPKPLENSYSEFDTFGNRVKYRPGAPTYR